jgi:hypothetical protein
MEMEGQTVDCPEVLQLVVRELEFPLGSVSGFISCLPGEGYIAYLLSLYPIL